jgi:3-oxoacyl-[acyl-carrier-protein] synthase-3
VTNHQLAETIDTSDAWIVERTGIRSRHRVAVEMATSDLAWRASVDALADAGITAAELDLILVATATPDQPVPSTGCFLQHRLGERGAVHVRGIPAMDVAAGCAGFGYALQMAAATIKAGLHRRVLVVGADCLTRITNYADRQSCILFGDGAGAVVVTAPGDSDAMADVLYTSIGADGAAADLIQIKAGGSREPASTDSVAGARHTLELRGREVFKTAVRQMSDCIEAAAAAVGVRVADFDLIVPHQANARIIEAVGKQLGAAEEKVVIDIAETGNMASASIPVALGRARASGRLQSGGGDKLVVVVGFGAGTTWACQVLAVKGR